MTSHVRLGLLGLVVLSLGCPEPVEQCIEGDEEVCDGGTLPADLCNSPEEAEADMASCHLPVNVGGADAGIGGRFISRLEDGGVDQDWYFARLPSTVNARTLLRVRAGYVAAQSAVNFSLSVLQRASDGGLAAVPGASAVDRHGTAAPRPVEIIVPFTQPDARLYLLAANERVGTTVPPVDNRNPYFVQLSVQENPDVNEPNDTAAQATTIALAGTMGSQTGYLATTNDVDQYRFQVPPGGQRRIVYLRITGPTPHPTNPPPPFRLSYTLFDPMDVPISEGSVSNEFLAIDLATARLSPMGGTYRVEVKANRSGTTGDIRGDLRLQYTVAVQLFDDLDTNEPNDSITTSKVVPMNPNSSQTLTGRISYVPDEEWFTVRLSARPQPSVLRYRVRVAAGGGRFPPLSATPARQLRLVQQVTTGMNAADRQNNCITSAALCPRPPDISDEQNDLVAAVCRTGDPPPCLYAQRAEFPRFNDLKNFVGAIPVPAGAARDVFLQFRDEGRGDAKYADDREWTLELEWNDDPDEASRIPTPPTVALGSGPTQASGELTFGYGRTVFDFDLNDGDGIRAPSDYDAFDTDRDLIRFTYGGAAGDQAWNLSWDILHPDGGSSPAELVVNVIWCGAGATPDGGLCAGQVQRGLAYTPDRLTPWYLPMAPANDTVLFRRQTTGTSTTITLEPAGCWCHSASEVAAGQFFIELSAANRVRNDPLRYVLTQSLGSYPQSFNRDGGSQSCPVSDGGCRFSRSR